MRTRKYSADTRPQLQFWIVLCKSDPISFFGHILWWTTAGVHHVILQVTSQHDDDIPQVLSSSVWDRLGPGLKFIVTYI